MAAVATCMRRVPEADLFAAQKVVDKKGLLYNVPRMDGTLLPAQGTQLAKRRQPLTAMIGTTANEDSIFVLPEYLTTSGLKNVTVADVRDRCARTAKGFNYTANVHVIVQKYHLASLLSTRKEAAKEHSEKKYE